MNFAPRETEALEAWCVSCVLVAPEPQHTREHSEASVRAGWVPPASQRQGVTGRRGETQGGSSAVPPNATGNASPHGHPQGPTSPADPCPHLHLPADLDLIPITLPARPPHPHLRGGPQSRRRPILLAGAHTRNALPPETQGSHPSPRLRVSWAQRPPSPHSTQNHAPSLPSFCPDHPPPETLRVSYSIVCPPRQRGSPEQACCVWLRLSLSAWHTVGAQQISTDCVLIEYLSHRLFPKLIQPKGLDEVLFTAQVGKHSHVSSPFHRRLGFISVAGSVLTAALRTRNLRRGEAGRRR